MSIEVKVPAVGESISTGILSVWHKNDGDHVSSGDVLFTLETDKISTEVNAPESGTLRTQVAAGEEVRIGQTVALIETEVTPPAQPQSRASTAITKKESSPPTPSPQKSHPTQLAEPLHQIEPARSHPAVAEQNHSLQRVTRKKLTPLRRKIAQQLVLAQHTAALLTTFNECDMSAVIQLRKEMQDEFLKRNGVKLGFMSFFIKAVVDALKAVPAINARIDGDELVINHYFDIGVAVGTDRGLIVPVIRDCDTKSFGEIEAGLASYATKAHEGKISLEDLQGGVFSISNGGIYGSLLSTPIINPPQSGILGMHKIQERPVALDGKVVIRPMMYLALSYDHRVVDGKEAVTFLVRVKECIENPARLLLGT